MNRVFYHMVSLVGFGLIAVLVGAATLILSAVNIISDISDKVLEVLDQKHKQAQK
ncbi:MAG: hypothetical protein ACI4J8_00710 [Oscillospiraceae bacterium]